MGGVWSRTRCPVDGQFAHARLDQQHVSELDLFAFSLVSEGKETDRCLLEVPLVFLYIYTVFYIKQRYECSVCGDI